jgi:hypothetical protein
MLTIKKYTNKQENYIEKRKIIKRIKTKFEFLTNKKKKERKKSTTSHSQDSMLPFSIQKKKKTQKQKRNNKIDSFIHITQKQKHALKKWGKEDKIT